MTVFFEDYDEVKQYVGTGYNNLDFDTIGPFTSAAGEAYLVPLLGRGEYDKLVTDWEAESVASEHVALLNKVRPAIAYFAHFLFAQEGGVTLNEDGIQRKEDENNKSAYQWQTRDYKRAQLDKGWTAMNALLVFLKDNVGDYALWGASPERTRVCKLMLPDVDTLAAYANVRDMATWWYLIRLQVECTRDILSKHITEDLMNDLLDGMLNDDLEAEEEEIKEMVQIVVAKYIMYEGLQDLPFRVSAGGVYLDTLEDGTRNIEKESQNLSDIKKYANREYKKMESALCDLKTYLNENATADKFADYYTAFIENASDDVVLNEDSKNVFIGF